MYNNNYHFGSILMDPELKTNLLNFETYKRFALMLIFVLIYSIVELIIYATAIFQILHLLITGKMHTELKRFAKLSKIDYTLPKLYLSLEYVV